VSGLELMRVEDLAAIAEPAARLTASLIDDALAARGVAHVALAGGTTPAGAHELLSPSSWEGVELWFGDERCVAPEGPESNYRMALETLLAHAGGARAHRIEGERGAEAAADAYDALLRSRVGGGADGVPVLDVVMLGIGEDGHIASLFPGHPGLRAPAGRVAIPVHDAPKPPPDRVSLTLAVLRAAGACLLLASGEGKADPLARMLAGPDEAVPASLLERDRLTVIADEAALSAWG
jgi:6-phosphogluconolactonase